MLFTDSGAFRGERGRIVRLTEDGDAWVRVEGERFPAPMMFRRKEMVGERDSHRHVGGAE